MALRDWIVSGREPPASLYPTLRSGTLVPLSAIHYPYMPAVNFTLQGVTTQKFYLDRGAANARVAARLLLPEDATFLINQANAAPVP
jgi:hypothetical protein